MAKSEENEASVAPIAVENSEQAIVVPSRRFEPEIMEIDAFSGVVEDTYGVAYNVMNATSTESVRDANTLYYCKPLEAKRHIDFLPNRKGLVRVMISK